VGFLEGTDRGEVSLLPPSVDSLALSELGFERTVAAASGPATC